MTALSAARCPSFVPGDLLTTIEAAELAGMTQDILRRYLHYGRLPGQKTPGGHWRVRMKDLVAFLADLQAISLELGAEDAVMTPAVGVAAGPARLEPPREARAGVGAGGNGTGSDRRCPSPLPRRGGLA